MQVCEHGTVEKYQFVRMFKMMIIYINISFQPRNHPYYDKAQIICNQILEEVLPDVTHEAVRQAMSELVGE